jgi:hypothetical protein
VDVLEIGMEENHFVITCRLTINNSQVATHVQIDCEATCIASMLPHCARNHQIPLQKFNVKKLIDVINGRPIESGDITHIERLA